MQVVRESSLGEYALWYLERESRKPNGPAAPADPTSAVATMWESHDGKMRSWFRTPCRCSVMVVEPAQLADVVFLECDWTKRERLVVPDGPNYRLLGRVADNARSTGYFTRRPADDLHAKHQAYYRALAAGTLSLSGANRLALCSAEASEVAQNPKAQYYLLDGVGRGLPYMLLTADRAIGATPVEAFVIDRVAT